jgi:hypothetical protein
MAIENLKKKLIIELFIFQYSFLAIWPAKEKAAWSRPPSVGVSNLDSERP